MLLTCQAVSMSKLTYYLALKLIHNEKMTSLASFLLQFLNMTDGHVKRSRPNRGKIQQLRPIIDQLSGQDGSKPDLQLHESLSNYFLSSDGLLCHVASQHNKTRPFIDKMVVPEPMKQHVIQKYHDTIWSGHLKFEKTLQKIRLSFFWKHMYTDVQKYVNSCRPCME